MKKQIFFIVFSLIGLHVYAQCVTDVFPSCTDFGLAGNVPNCWLDTGQDPWLVAGTWPFYGAGGMVNSGFIGVDGTDPNNGIARMTTESYDLSAAYWPTPPQLIFDIFSNNIDNPGDNALFTVEISADAGSIWSPLITYQADSASVLELSADLTPFTNDTVLFRFNIDYSVMTGFQFYNDILINNVCVKQTATCLSPSSLGAFNVSTSSASLYWTENGSANMWDVELGLAGFTPNGMPSTGYSGLTNDTVIVSGLVSATAYDFYVRADCVGDSSVWEGPFTFTTEPDYCAGDLFLDAGGLTGSYAPNESVIYVLCPDNPGEVVTVDFTAVSIYGAPFDYMEVYNGIGTSGQLLESDLQVPQSFTSYANDGCLSFNWNSDGFLELAGWSASVVCAPQGPCLAPDTADMDAIVSFPDTVNLFWSETGVGNVYNIEYRIVGNSVWTAAPGNPYSGTSAQLTGLATANYEWRIAAACSGPNPSSSMFAQETFTTIPFIGTCGDAQAIGPGSYTTPGANIGNGAGNFCGGGATHSNWYAYTSTVSGLVNIESTSGGDTYLAVYNGSCGALTCYASDDNGGFGLLSSLSFPICAGETYLLEWTDQNGATGPIDFTLTETASCTAPMDLVVNTITPYQLQGVSWTSGGGGCSGGAGYYYELVEAGDLPFAGNALHSDTGTYPLVPFNITGLNPNTTYELFVQDLCGGGASADSLFESWVTLPITPSNDSCHNAIPVFAGYTISGFSSVGATGMDLSSCTLGDDADVWFAYTATCDNIVQINTCGSSFNTSIAVFGDCMGANEIVCNNDIGISSPCPLTLQSFVEFPVDSGEIYYLRIAGHNGETGHIELFINELSTCSCTANIWTGVSNNNWNNAQNWSCNIIPTNTCSNPSDNAVIPTGATVTPEVLGVSGAGDLFIYPGASIVIDSSLELCGNIVHQGNNFTGSGKLVLMGSSTQTLSGNGTFTLVELNNSNGATVEATASLGVDSGLVLTNGAFTNNGNFTLYSAIDGTAYLDDFTGNGIYIGDLTVQRFVNNGFNGGVGRRYFGSAVVSSTVNGLDTINTSYPTGTYITPVACDPVNVSPNSANSNLLQWDEDAPFPTSCEQEGWFALDAALTSLTPGRGYLGWMQSGSILSVTGVPNTGMQSYATSNSISNSTNTRGYHVLANPYPSPLHLDAVTLESGLASPQYYNANGGPWRGTFQPVLIAGEEIPVMQGFTAYSDGSGAFTPNNTYRVASTNADFGKSNNWFDFRLDIEVNIAGMGDITYLFYSGSNTNQFDIQSDCEKRESDRGRPTLFTKSQGSKMSLNGLNLNDLGVSVPMGFITPVNDVASFSFSGMNTFPANTNIYLEDKVEGSLHNLISGPYTFDADVLENGTDRFEIHFSLPAYFDLIEPTCDSNQAVIVEQTNDGRIMTISNAGVLVETTILDGSANVLPPGDYEIEVFDGFGASQSYAFIIEDLAVVDGDILASDTLIEVGGVINFEFVGTGAMDYQWFVNGQLIAQTAMFSWQFDTPGQYNVEVRASNNDCNVLINENITVTEQPNAIFEIDKGNVTINTLQGDVEVVFNNLSYAKADIKIFNMLGQSIASATTENSTTYKLNNPGWPAAYYVVHVQTNKNFITQTLWLQK